MTNARRRLLGGAGASILAAASFIPKQARSQERRRRVVFPVDFSPLARDRIRRLLAEQGFEDGRNVSLEFLPLADLTEGQGSTPAPAREEQEKLAKDIVASRPDVIAMPAYNEMYMFQRLTREVPIVFFHYASDPVQAGWVDSLRKPGRNITGTTLARVEAIPKYWSLLKEFRPNAKRGGSLATAEYRAQGAHWKLVEEAQAKASALLGIEIVELSFERERPFSVVRELIQDARVELLTVVLHPTWPGMEQLLEHLKASSIPALYVSSATMVRRGGLISHGPNFAESEKAGMAIIARVLRGESPANIPVQQVDRFHVAVNLRTAKAMGIEVPRSVLVQADELIQ